ncbi:MAG: hypothetical protein LBK13_01175 [Spirochaetales bacterium]|nr:hypothetical protein [Spirochaetales bacterium]
MPQNGGKFRCFYSETVSAVVQKLRFLNNSIISDTSCLIALTNTGNLDILHQVCQTVFITPEIAAEYGEGLPGWITVTPVQDSEKTRLIQKKP